MARRDHQRDRCLLLSWLVLIITLAVRRPKGNLLKEALHLLPDLLHLLKRLSTNLDRAVAMPGSS